MTITSFNAFVQEKADEINADINSVGPPKRTAAQKAEVKKLAAECLAQILVNLTVFNNEAKSVGLYQWPDFCDRRTTPAMRLGIAYAMTDYLENSEECDAKSAMDQADGLIPPTRKRTLAMIFTEIMLGTCVAEKMLDTFPEVVAVFVTSFMSFGDRLDEERRRHEHEKKDTRLRSSILELVEGARQKAHLN